ncbi:leucine-rich repeat-containing G-protein coupled receptor 5-like [Ruditapes philippinarum]|uniref:leucine-rich repeat-containing G-protein coupled receptor 5-like n=1 Tax=Ruditapes philippinarum TaxID=129788 RepID=UPI00295BE205|nr:leucine-rich repeat-containing G-protein coupled receptor 5-like [Ruditapes philippinarum]
MTDKKMVLRTLCLSLLTVAILSQKPPTNCPDINPDPATQCSCTSEIIDCSERGLTELPKFSVDTFYKELRLDHNDIENITDDAFKNLHSLNRIFMQDNNISRFDRYAFRGAEQAPINRIDLSNNFLTEFPQAIGNLESINWIDVTNNPINENNFDQTTMYNIGDTLTRFEFGSPKIESWPPTLRHLQALEFLNVSGGSFYTLPPEAFHGFEGTLTTLSIQNTNLIALPLALARLRFLDRLYFDHNHDIGDSGVLIPSFGNSDLLNKLRYISLVDDNLTVFPSLLQFLRNVEQLVLDSNSLAFVSDTSVQVAVGTKITDLSLRNCSLSRVPGALSKLTNLTKLNLAENDIHSFENSDFDNMGKLLNLTITKNPLGYIANETFKDLKSLQYLDLKESNINTMPEAIRFLKNLQELKLPSDKIECTCNIVWFKQFMEHCNTGLRIDGSCETISYPVDVYLRDFIPKCPNYKNGTACV